jgi:RHS repeat-associated protein
MMCTIQWKVTTQYAYEVGGKLKQVTLPDSSTVTYAYDALGNRIRKLSSSLDIHYQYSQGACRREIHKDPATQNILRTITYHPWGMNISANQTSTDYYFITDFRGWVWGLTDDSGTIVESYNYDPFGRILAGSLLSHARFLSGAHEGQWDAETGLYYLGARYYDPSLGRFIQEDAVEGSADLPASQNRYVYCQNDPVSLIDPTGYSPENTGTPARFTPMNYSNIRSSEGGITSCYLEDYTPVVAEVQDPHRSPINLNEERRLAAMRRAAERDSNPRFIEGAFDSNDGCSEYYTYVNVGGELVKVRYDKDGNILGIEYNGENGEIVATAIHMAFLRIRNEGGITSAAELRSLLESINAFAADNYSTFEEIFNSSERKTLLSFTYHAMIGGYVATQMQKYDNPEYNKYDMSFGFWASFWASRSGLEIGILPDYKGAPTGNTPLCLVDVANLLKAIAMNETHLGTDTDSMKEDANKEYVGLMQVGWKGLGFMESVGNTHWGSTYGYGLNFPKYGNAQERYRTNHFLNIGAGTGHLWNKLTVHTPYPYSTGERRAPTLNEWLLATKNYYGKGKTLSEWYPADIESILTKGIKTYYGKTLTKVLFSANDYYKNRRRRQP